jgi:glycosyltransferase involved in cell wall biosynthesis
MAEDLQVVLVHERFTDFAGSEKVVSELAGTWPDARVLAPITRVEGMDEVLSGRVEPGSLTRWVRGQSYAHLLPALPLAMRRLPVGSPDVVIASHHAFANQVVHASSAPVVSYVHSPARWVWDPAMRRGEAGGALGAAGLGAFAAAYRRADRSAAARVHTLLANSSAVAERITAWWGRSAQVVHPPVDTGFYRPDPDVPREEFFLIAGRLVPYKRPDLAVRAARAAGVRLIVAGSGRAEAACRQWAGADVTFLGRVDDHTQRDLYRRCRALLLPGVEDFGIVPVEAAATGAPVLAAAAGGALDTVRPGQTGTLVATPTDDAAAVEAWAAALRDFRSATFDPAAIRAHAESFSRDAFRDRMRSVVGAAARGPSGP